MEHIIASLLQNFEEGKMNRRQLIQSLAVAASGASVVGSVPAYAAEGGFKATGIYHISYQVADYAKTRDFYKDLFAMKVSEDDGKQCRLAVGNCFLMPRTRPSNTPLVDHIAYSIDNWNRDAALAELKRRGLNPQPDGKNSFQIVDPDGYHVQLNDNLH